MPRRPAPPRSWLLAAAVVALWAGRGAAAQEADTVAVDTAGVVRPAPPAVALPAVPAGPPVDVGLPVAGAAEGGLEAPVAYTARDSVRIVLARRDSLGPDEAPDDVVTLFGEAQATYQEATVGAGRLQYRAGAQTVRADPLGSDSSAVGVPQFASGAESFQGDAFVYNLASQRGRVTGARTQIQDGYLLGGVIKQRTEDVVYAQDAAYTTCELDHPHYALEAGRLKVVGGEEVYSGPVRLKILGITMPVILPFGYFPTAEGRRSGPLPVRYGQESGFGLFLDNVGWYWAISDYLDAQATAKVGTEGSFLVRGAARYNKLYAYNGDVSLQVGRLRSGEPTDPDFSPRIPFNLRVSHNQTLPAGQRLTASINLRSESQRFVAQSVEDQVETSTQSSVGYSQSWPSVGRALNVSLQAYQDFTGATPRTSVTFPTLSFTQQRRFPFRRGRDDRWYEKISVAYSNQTTNSFNFQATADTSISALEGLFSPSAFADATGRDQRFVYQVTQNVPVQAAFQIPRFNLSLSPSLNYRETWVGERTEIVVDSAGAFDSRQVPGFTAVRQAALSASASTEFYGTFPLRVGRIDGLRHTVRPNVSLQFEPDYEAFGFVRETAPNPQGETRRYAIVPGIPLNPQRALSFGVSNAFLVRTASTDSTGETTRTARQVLSLDVSGSYNFAATERPLSDVSARATSQFWGVSANGNATFSPYAIDSTGRSLTQTYLDQTGRPLRLSAVSLRLSRSFKLGGAGREEDVRPVVAAPGTEAYDPGAFGPRPAVVGYIDYAAPLSFSLSATINHRPAPGALRPTTATIELGQLNARLTPKWSVSGRTGFDLVQMEPTATSLQLRRDLHCWEMAIGWQPLGPVRGFSFSLYVKSGYLRDILRINVPQSTVRRLPFPTGF
ncbi:putative LPS assembly protein LptD [Rubrivirga sp. S365]|uniref:putative LPS assembly protein LptD n=1 Tax=Rubrivirga sp. S365 TaxID=3076080 RepID=UPI0028C9CB7C|nr:putative LPS assembly protein LptD [Rubrivirga sp. S365]MDT7857271.1 putative LPS assembly protein LptD [Rubrivirga sp. S365]